MRRLTVSCLILVACEIPVVGLLKLFCRQRREASRNPVCLPIKRSRTCAMFSIKT
jgi:hypothetical protein